MLALAAGLAAPAVAQAQQQTFYLDRLFLAGAPDDAIGLWRPSFSPKTRFFGQLGLGFAYNPFRVENELSNPSSTDQRIGNPVTYQLQAYADLGFEIVERFSVQVELPVILNQGSNVTNGSSDATVATSPSSAAAMDARLDARVVIWRNEARTLKLGAEAAVWFPSGNKYSYSGDGATAGGLGLAAEYDFSKFFIVANTGFQFRPYNGLNGFGVTHEWRYAVGAYAPFLNEALRVGGTLFGSVGLSGGNTFVKANAPLEWQAEGRYYIGEKKRMWVGLGGGTRMTPGYSPDFRFVAVFGGWVPIGDTEPPSPNTRFKFADHGADRDGDKIPDDIDLCPDDPEDGKPPNPDDGCPALPDRDGDGIPDNVDKCPDQPEDFDGVQDADGCPEDDADKDGIPDAQDACPKEPGDPDPDPKKNGCPKFIRRISGSTEIQILKVIEFATGRAEILKKSFPILDEVVRLLKVNPDIKHLDIEGHTDNRGSDQLNEKLSNDRAHSVMKYLSEHGIDAGRLSAQGFGPKRPIADNNTPDGRQRNRRVEFHIKDAGGEKPSPSESPP